MQKIGVSIHEMLMVDSNELFRLINIYVQRWERSNKSNQKFDKNINDCHSKNIMYFKIVYVIIFRLVVLVLDSRSATTA